MTLGSFNTLETLKSSSGLAVVGSAIVGLMLVVGGVFWGLKHRNMQHQLLRMDDYSETPSDL
jgi:hypothetical protein